MSESQLNNILNLINDLKLAINNSNEPNPEQKNLIKTTINNLNI